MRNQATFFLNGRRRAVDGPAAFGSLTDYLRDDQGLVGTKVGCGEGDCGACTVLVGRPDGDRVRYLAATSCILTPCQVDGAHVVTVEGLQASRHDPLTPIQAALVEHHGSQCGYCTPGFVMALTGLFEQDGTPAEGALRTALTGNLCRCTGYLPILDAGRAVAQAAAFAPLADLYPAGPLVDELRSLAADPLRVEADGRIFGRPRSLADAVAFRAEHPGAVIIGGGTDLGVWRNRRGFDPDRLLSLAGVEECSGIALRDGEVVIGANATWAELERFARAEAPGLAALTDHFAAPQIRHVATFLGNVAGGSPIADAVAGLHVLGARLELVGPRGARSVAIGDFFLGYRETALAPDEIIARLAVRPPRGDERFGLYKVSKRKEMDISTFRAAILVREDFAGGRVDRAILAFAGVGPRVIRLPSTAAFLKGQPLTEATFRAAGARARAEIEPISDLRGSRDHRLILAENVLVQFCREHIVSGQGGHAHVG